MDMQADKERILLMDMHAFLNSIISISYLDMHGHKIWVWIYVDLCGYQHGYNVKWDKMHGYKRWKCKYIMIIDGFHLKWIGVDNAFNFGYHHGTWIASLGI